MTFRACVALMFLVLLAPAARAQDDGLLRLGFFPPMDTDIVYRIEYRHDEDLAGAKASVGWEHEIVLRIAGREPPDLLAGTFTLRKVTDLEGAGRDPFYLIAKAIEGESHRLKMLDAGVPVEVDWPAISERVNRRLPALTDAATASTIRAALPGFGPDGVTGVMRPFWVTGTGYLRAFAKDGSLTTVNGLELPAFYPVSGSTLESYGGKLENSDDLLHVWRISSDRTAAAKALGPQLAGLAARVAAGADRAKVQAMVDSAIAGGIEAIEGGVAVYDLTPGLMREVTLEARLVAGSLRRDTRIVITRLAPE